MTLLLFIFVELKHDVGVLFVGDESGDVADAYTGIWDRGRGRRLI
jgi:hypothetical protein